MVYGKNTVVMSAGKSIPESDQYSAILDRSPCGSGTAAIMVNLFQKGLLKIGETFEHESIIGSKFTGKLLREGPTLKGIHMKYKMTPKSTIANFVHSTPLHHTLGSAQIDPFHKTQLTKAAFLISITY